MKTLISWMAYGEDFNKDASALNQDGPHCKLYSHHLEHLGCDKHILLTDADTPDKTERMKRLEHNLKARIETSENLKHVKQMDCKTIALSDAWNLHEIFVQLEKYILANPSEQFLAMINTGTRDMQAAWYLLAHKYTERLELFKVKHPNYSKNKEGGDLERPVKIEKDILSTSFTVRSEGEPISLDFEDFQKEARKRATEIAKSPDTTTLILGEHGTGKESLAKTVHDRSLRKNGPFRITNCAGLTDELLRSELFGHMKGSFTGANENKKGLFEEAKGGTVFLDEIGDISAFMQVSLLRVLQNKKITPIGGNKEISIDVRIVAATNKDLIEECEKGAFRWDLYYRLAKAEVTTLPLREFDLKKKRKAINYFIEEAYNKKFKEIGKSKIQLSKETKALLDAYEFPGNIRELENLIEGLYTYEASEITPELLPLRMKRSQAALDETLDAAKARHAHYILNKYGNNKTKAQKVLDIGSQNTLNKILDYPL